MALEWEHTDRHMHTQDKYRNPPVHACQGLIIEAGYCLVKYPNTYPHRQDSLLFSVFVAV